MGHRLSRIVTRTGDAGTTGLGDGSRVPKDSPRIEAIGAVDELNSSIGVVLAENRCPRRSQSLLDRRPARPLRPRRRTVDSRACGDDARRTSRGSKTRSTRYNADLPPLKEFILPGGARPAALMHVARTVCRRAERVVVALATSDAVSPSSRIYLNRLSDLLFVLARAINRAAGAPDVLWQKGRARGSPGP